MKNKVKTYNGFVINIINHILEPITQRNFLIESEVLWFRKDRWIYKIDFYPTKEGKQSETLQTVVIEVLVSFSSFDDEEIAFNGFGLNTEASYSVSAYDVTEQLESLCSKLESLL